MTEYALDKSPLFNKQIQKYNHIIEEIASLYDNVKIIESFDGRDASLYQTDGMHFSVQGQYEILKKIINYLCNELNINILPSPSHPPRKSVC